MSTPNIVVGQTRSTTSSNRYPPNSSSSYYNFKLSVKLNSQSIVNNSSNITVTLAICASFRGDAWSGGTAPTFKTQKNVNGGSWVDISSTSWSSFHSDAGGTYYTILSNTFDIPHKDDGSAIFSLYYVTTHGTNGWAPPATDGSISNIIPPDIPRNASIYFKPEDPEDPNSDTWMKSRAYVKVSDVWRQAKRIYVKTEGTWKEDARKGK